ncbi:MAG: tRNA (adenosine(37)-N6)-threonylcarbamoyltransferase complex ATPase subunit type 1 TsaE [Bacteroidales bacterium]|nr:tRNA (adenosine(37)-N6)-threonylcarbamoyltransferase complex ATPase subunit type 1 TsaE [Bacteroidales bacterium]
MKPAIVKSLNDLPGAAAMILEYLNKPSVVAMFGEMGAGKTTFIIELCRKLGVTDVVNSPTFALVRSTAPKTTRKCTTSILPHKKLEEAYDIGIDEYFNSGSYCFIEWPEMIEDILPEDCIKIKIDPQSDKSRTISILKPLA